MTEEEQLISDLEQIYLDMEEAEQIVETGEYTRVFARDINEGDFIEFGGDEYFVTQKYTQKYAKNHMCCLFLRSIDSGNKILITLQQQYLISVRKNQ